MSKFIDASSSLEDEEMNDINSNEISEDNNEEEEDEEINSNEDSDKMSEEENSISSSNSEAQMYQNNKVKEKNNDNIKYNNYNPPNNEVITFNNTINTIKTEIDKVNSQLDTLDKNLENETIELKYGLSFFEAKYQMFIMYLTELICYMSEKISAKESVENSPIINQLIILKGLIEKSKVIDMKLKPQIDRLLSIADNKEKNIETGLKSRLLENDNSNEEISENENLNEENSEEELNKQIKNREKAKYKINKANIEFFETKNEKRERKRQIEHDKEKLRDNEFIKELKEEMSNKPKLIESYNSKKEKYMKEIEDYENEHFTNLRVPKAVLKRLNKADRKLEDLNFFEKELRQTSNVLLNDDYESKKKLEEKNKFIQRKRVLNEFNSEKSRKKGNQNFGKKKKKRH